MQNTEYCEHTAYKLSIITHTAVFIEFLKRYVESPDEFGTRKRLLCRR